ncbi:MAG: FkbM family methyltransferase [Desulfovibrio sp.]|jgi:FkbM family methyltransferase|nr:FkbM family methyltransferase [Desulfovibrio sp.]
MSQNIHALYEFLGWEGQYADTHLFFWCKKYWRDKFIKVAEDIGRREHQANVGNLFRNLREDAKRNLAHILDLEERFSRPACFSYSDLFLDEDWLSFRKYEEFKNSIVPEKDCWQYKNYKLPRALHLREFISSVFLYQHGIKQLKNFKAIADKAIIDAGAFVCDSALVFHYLAPENAVISFEPAPRNFALAGETLALNDLRPGKEVILENMALGEKTGRVQFISEAKHWGGSAILPSGKGLPPPSPHTQKNIVSVPMETLDNYVRGHSLRVGLIKTDLEGYEWKFLQGALETIKTQRPILLLSIYHCYDDFYKIKPFIESLNLGYKFDFFYGVCDNPWSDIMLLAEIY